MLLSLRLHTHNKELLHALRVYVCNSEGVLGLSL